MCRATPSHRGRLGAAGPSGMQALLECRPFCAVRPGVLRACGRCANLCALLNPSTLALQFPDDAAHTCRSNRSRCYLLRTLLIPVARLQESTARAWSSPAARRGTIRHQNGRRQNRPPTHTGSALFGHPGTDRERRPRASGRWPPASLLSGIWAPRPRACPRASGRWPPGSSLSGIRAPRPRAVPSGIWALAASVVTHGHPGTNTESRRPRASGRPSVASPTGTGSATAGRLVATMDDHPPPSTAPHSPISAVAEVTP